MESMKITKIEKSIFDLSGKKPKTKKYKVTLNWFGEVTVIYTHSITEKAALQNVMRRLGQTLGVSFSRVRAYILNSQKDRWRVKEVER